MASLEPFLRKGEDPDVVNRLDEVIAEGAFGIVYKGVNIPSGQEVAVKIIQLENDETFDDLAIEVEVLHKCHHPNIVGYFGCWRKNDELHIAMEYCDGGSTSDIYETLNVGLSEDEIQLICRESLKGLKYMHSLGFMHRDIKGANILVKSDGSVKLIDFGVCGKFSAQSPTRRTFIGTPYWMAPEVIENKMTPSPYDVRADVWSLGITLIELAHGNPPLSNMQPMKALFQIPYRTPPTLGDQERWSPEFEDFVAKCLVKKCKDRATVDQLIEHPWLRSCGDKQLLVALVAEYLEEKEKQKEEEENEPMEDETEEEHQAEEMLHELQSSGKLGLELPTIDIQAGVPNDTGRGASPAPAGPAADNDTSRKQKDATAAAAAACGLFIPTFQPQPQQQQQQSSKSLKKEKEKTAKKEKQATAKKDKEKEKDKEDHKKSVKSVKSVKSTKSREHSRSTSGASSDHSTEPAEGAGGAGAGAGAPVVTVEGEQAAAEQAQAERPAEKRKPMSKKHKTCSSDTQALAEALPAAKVALGGEASPLPQPVTIAAKGESKKKHRHKKTATVTAAAAAAAGTSEARERKKHRSSKTTRSASSADTESQQDPDEAPETSTATTTTAAAGGAASEAPSVETATAAAATTTTTAAAAAASEEQSSDAAAAATEATATATAAAGGGETEAVGTVVRPTGVPVNRPRTVHRGTARRTQEIRRNIDRRLMRRQFAEIKALTKQHQRMYDMLESRNNEQMAKITKSWAERLNADQTKRAREDEKIAKRVAAERESEAKRFKADTEALAKQQQGALKSWVRDCGQEQRATQRVFEEQAAQRAKEFKETDKAKEKEGKAAHKKMREQQRAERRQERADSEEELELLFRQQMEMSRVFDENLVQLGQLDEANAQQTEQKKQHFACEYKVLAAAHERQTEALRSEIAIEREAMASKHQFEEEAMKQIQALVKEQLARRFMLETQQQERQQALEQRDGAKQIRQQKKKQLDAFVAQQKEELRAAGGSGSSKQALKEEQKARREAYAQQLREEEEQENQAIRRKQDEDDELLRQSHAEQSAALTETHEAQRVDLQERQQSEREKAAHDAQVRVEKLRLRQCQELVVLMRQEQIEMCGVVREAIRAHYVQRAENQKREVEQMRAQVRAYKDMVVAHQQARHAELQQRHALQLALWEKEKRRTLERDAIERQQAAERERQRRDESVALQHVEDVIRSRREMLERTHEQQIDDDADRAAHIRAMLAHVLTTSYTLNTEHVTAALAPNTLVANTLATPKPVIPNTPYD